MLLGRNNLSYKPNECNKNIKKNIFIVVKVTGENLCTAWIETPIFNVQNIFVCSGLYHLLKFFALIGNHFTHYNSPN